MNVDLTYTNKAGISLQNVIDILSDGNNHTKKDIQSGLKTEKSIDVLLKKLETSSMVEKRKTGNKLLYTVSAKNKTPQKTEVKTTEKPVQKKEPKVVTPVVKKTAPKKNEDVKIKQPTPSKPKKTEVKRKRKTVVRPTPKEEKVPELKVVEQPVTSKKPVPPKSIVTPTVTQDNKVKYQPAKPRKTKKLTKAKVKGDSPARVKSINEQTANVTKDHQITALVDMEDHQKTKKPQPTTREVSQSDLDILKREMEGRLGKEVTTILHKRNSRAVRDRKMSAQEIFEKQQKELSQSYGEVSDENPYRFILNFFTSTLNGEKATPYFRRRDEYVIKSLYNKFRALCEPVDDYLVSPHNLPFYRSITINEEEWVVKIYHIDMNRVIRGVYTIFRLNKFDDRYIKFK